MKKTLILSAFALFTLTTNAQQTVHKRCLTTEYMHYRENLQSGYIQSTQEVFQNAKNNSTNKTEDVYTIPVVVHVVYKTENQNLHDSIIHDQIRILNEDYNRANADTVNMRSVFAPYVGKANIRFQLASYDPSGNPTTGITRTQTSTTTFGDLLGIFTNDFSSMEKVKSTANGGKDAWNPSKYLNIWVCNMAISVFGQETPALLGYATPPAGLSNWPSSTPSNLGDGVVIQYHVFGSNNPNEIVMGEAPYVTKGRTVTHEVGHYLGLRHVWGDGNCSVDDGIADTPNASEASEQDCDVTKNTCVDNIGGVDLPDMIENYMDYSAEDCQNSITKQQIALIRGVIENNRWDLVTNEAALAINTEDEIVFDIYPNPTMANFTVSTKQQITDAFIISDLQGKFVKTVLPTGSNTIISLEDLETGMYQIQITYNSQRITRNIVKL